ncbi:hypothetical protein ECZU51_46720 [Escherichia coli]|nr:hypothetical protein ECZU51_46720 [Escherichia coli]
MYDGEVNTVSRAGGSAPESAKAGSSDGRPGKSVRMTARRPAGPPRYDEPLPVLLTRYAAQSLYAPLRTLNRLRDQTGGATSSPANHHALPV